LIRKGDEFYAQAEGDIMEMTGSGHKQFEKELRKLRSENTSLRKRISFLEKMSEFDEITQLYSQGYFERRFTQELRRAERYCEFLSLVMIDMSSALADQSSSAEVKAIKDLGHLVGETVRATDILAKLGTNRLALLLTETPKEGAFRLAERLAEKITGSSLSKELQKLKEGLLNIGIASFPEDGGNQDDLLQVASSPLNSGSSVLRSSG
jgi:diguanylate cyclase (GGDEF)-like protein